MIRSLERGGAERQLIELARGLAHAGFRVTVGTLYDGGALRAELARAPGVELQSFGKGGRWDPRFTWRLARAIRSARPDVIHGYMSPANELAVLLGRLCGAKSVCGLRASDMDLSLHWVGRVLFQLGALASRYADVTVANSEAGRVHHVRHGYDAKRMTVIHNGIDCERFRPNTTARASLRAEWGVGPEDRLVGLVGRIDPMKDHATFLRAVARIRHEQRVRFVCVGGGDDALRASLLELAEDLGISERLLWPGARDDMSSVYNALDLVVSSSAFGEGFSNVIAEAMAVERVCIVTAVGDSALIVGDTGAVVPPSDAQALADAMSWMLALPASELDARGAAARQRVVSEFSRQHLIERTAALLRSIAGPRARSSGLSWR